MSWPTVKLGDVMTVGRGSSPRPIKDERFFTGGTIPWVKIADATASGKFIYQTNQHVNDYGASFSRKLKPGALIFPASGTLGIPRFLGVEACIHDGWLYFSDYQGIDPDWLYYRIILLKDYYEGIAYGAAIQNINTDIVRNTEIQLPDLAMQRAMAAVLGAYDDLIATNQRRIALLEEAARRLYREWFVHLRFPDHESVPVKDGVPEGWERGSAHDFISILSGGTPKTGVEHFWGGDIPFFTPKDSPDAYYVLGSEKTLTEAGLASCNSRLFAKNTTFITARGTVGKVALAQKPMAMNQSCYALVPKQDYDNLFLFAAIKDAVEHFKQVAVGGVFDAIVVDTFKVIPFVLPEAGVTTTFGNAVRPLFQQAETLLLQNQQLAQTRDLLLPKLMSGQLDVSGIALPDEVAA
jgi:type I restriction enzyme, S subunit